MTNIEQQIEGLTRYGFGEELGDDFQQRDDGYYVPLDDVLKVVRAAASAPKAEQGSSLAEKIVDQVYESIGYVEREGLIADISAVLASAPKAELPALPKEKARLIVNEHDEYEVSEYEDQGSPVFDECQMNAYAAAWARAVLAQAAPVAAVPVAWMKFRAAQSWDGRGDIDYNEWLEVCQPGEIGDDKLPAFPVYAAPAAPVAAAVPFGWIDNQGWEPLTEAELRDGTLVAQEASAYAWEIDGEHEPGDIIRCRVSFTAKRGFIEAAPAPDEASK